MELDLTSPPEKAVDNLLSWLGFKCRLFGHKALNFNDGWSRALHGCNCSKIQGIGWCSGVTSSALHTENKAKWKPVVTGLLISVFIPEIKIMFFICVLCTCSVLAPPPSLHTKIPEELGSEPHSVSPWQNSPCFLFLSTANVTFPLQERGALSSSISHLLPDGKWVIFIPSSSVAWHWGLFPA